MMKKIKAVITFEVDEELCSEEVGRDGYNIVFDSLVESLNRVKDDCETYGDILEKTPIGDYKFFFEQDGSLFFEM